MSQKDKIHYNVDSIDRIGANFNLIIGERSNGKSYQVKHKKGVEQYLFGGKSYHDQYFDKGNIIENNIKQGTRFILLRRFKDEITTDNVEKYFNDVDIFKLTDGKYNCIVAYKRRIYLANYNSETGKSTKGDHIGYYMALSQEQNSAGNSLLDVTDILFEEFISRSMYLGNNEPTKLLNFYSTVDRKRGTTRVWLVGNSISKVCPYFNEWGLREIFNGMKQGDIKSKWIPTGDIDDNGYPVEVKLAIEFCKSSGRSSFVFGDHAEMLNRGGWQSDPQPHLPKSYNSYDVEFRIVFMYQAFKFLGELLTDKETSDYLWFIKPYKGEIDEDTIVFSDVIKQSIFWQRDIYNSTIPNKRIYDILRTTFREHMIFYSDDMTGTDFKQVIDFEIKR